jgi:hypothetical protein
VVEAEMKDREPIPLDYHRTPEDERLKPGKMPAWKFFLLIYFVIGGVFLFVDIASNFSQRPIPRKVVPTPKPLPPPTASGVAVR